jgi:hypothetical protein
MSINAPILEPAAIPTTPAIYCADIGANNEKAKKFGWWSNCEPRPVDSLEAEADLEPYRLPSQLAAAVGAQLGAGQPVALGFECPLFIPFRANEMELTKGRPEDLNRPWSAGAGCGSLTTGLVQVAWVLRAIRESLPAAVQAFLDVSDFRGASQGLLLWEAFVSAEGKPNAGETGEAKAKDPRSHVRDAEHAVKEFERRWQGDCLCPVTTEPVYSLVGAGLLRSGWSGNAGLLEQACVIVRTGEGPCPCEKKAAGE